MPGFQDSKSLFTLYFRRNVSGIASFELIKKPTYELPLGT